MISIITDIIPMSKNKGICSTLPISTPGYESTTGQISGRRESNALSVPLVSHSTMMVEFIGTASVKDQS